MRETKAPIGEIEKALQEVAKVVECNDSVESIKITLTIKKQKPNKATTESK